MSIPSIPKGLKVVIAGYGFDAPDGAMRTDVAGGAPRYALEFDRGPQRFNVGMVLTSLQFSIWNLFFLNVVKKGTISFYLPLDSGFGVSPHLVNIVPGSYSIRDLNVAVSSIAFTVEAESQAYQFDDDEAQTVIDLYDLYGEGMMALLDRISVFANSDTLVLNFP